MKKPVIAGNWKMNHDPAETRRFFDAFGAIYPEDRNRTVAFFPPALSFAAAVDATSDRPDLLLGVQNLHWEETGAYTGEISAAMAAAAGAALALVGHSERRQHFAETDEEAARKVGAAFHAGLVPVLCVGETLGERERGDASSIVRRQLAAVLEGLEHARVEGLVIAYEPVWAIGTGRSASTDDAAEMHGFIRGTLRERFGPSLGDSVPILYGGSVKPGNAGDLLRAANVDGLLVGGASLDPVSFAAICGVS